MVQRDVRVLATALAVLLMGFGFLLVRRSHSHAVIPPGADGREANGSWRANEPYPEGRRDSGSAQAESSVSEVARLIIRVTDLDTRQPIPGVRVGAAGEEAELVCRTDADGIAVIEINRTGAIDVSANATGFISRSQTFNLLVGKTTKGEINLQGVMTLVGTVLSDSDGQPISGALVNAFESCRPMEREPATRFRVPLCNSARTDSRGKFRLNDIQTGTGVVLRASAPDHIAVEISIGYLTRQADPAPVEFRLRAGGRVQGFVRDRVGHAIFGAKVYLVPGDTPALLDDLDIVTYRNPHGPREAFCAKTGEDGSFLFDAVPFGESYIALARAEGHGDSEAVHDVWVSPGQPQQSLDIIVRLPGSLHVSVMSPEGTPVEGAIIEIASSNTSQRNLTTNARGQAIVSGMGIGLHRVTVIAPELPVDCSVHSVREGEATYATIQLLPACSIVGSAIDDLGRPVPSAAVYVDSPVALGPQPSADGGWAVTDERGRFRIGGLPPGSHRLIAQLVQRPRAGELIANAPSAGVVLVLRRQSRLRVQLAIRNGDSPPGSILVCIDDRIQHRTWSGGELRFDGVEPGRRRISFHFRKFATVEAEVEFIPGETLDLGEIQLESGNRLIGHVQDKWGAAIGGAVVCTGRARAPIDREAITDQAGRFELCHLPQGRIAVSVNADGFLGRTVEADVPGASTSIVLDQGGSLSGTVKLRDGTPVPNAAVHIRPFSARAGPAAVQTEGAVLRTDSSGGFSIRLPPALYSVDAEIERPGSLASSVNAVVSLRDGVSTTVNLELDGGSR